MCASSCSRSASRCSVGKPLSAPTGTRTTGRSQPTTIGTCRSGETSNCTGPERPILPLSFFRISCHSRGARRTSIERMRAATTHPPASRIQNATAPASQTITTQIRNCAGCTPETVASPRLRDGWRGKQYRREDHCHGGRQRGNAADHHEQEPETKEDQLLHDKPQSLVP